MGKLEVLIVATSVLSTPSVPPRIVLHDDELTEERLGARLPWSKGSPVGIGSHHDQQDAHHIALLLSTARQQGRGEAFCSTDEVRLAYVALCAEFGKQPRSRASVYRMLRNLEAKKYVELVWRGHGRASMVYLADKTTDGGETATSEEVALQQPLAILVLNGKPWCPTCHHDLTEEGAVNWPAPDFANLTVDASGKVRVNDVQKGDGDTKSAECSACGQNLQSKGWWS